MSALLTFAGFLPPFLLVPLFAADDRLFGMKRDGTKTKGWKAGVLAIAVAGGFAVAGLTGALFGLGWFVYRSLDFTKDSQTVRDGGDLSRAILRHAASVLPALLIAVTRGLDVGQTAIAFAAYALVAVVLAVFYGRAVAKAEKAGEGIGKQNVAVEIARGAAFGAATWFVLS